jgi:hypothetical protein
MGKVFRRGPKKGKTLGRPIQFIKNNNGRFYKILVVDILYRVLA